MTLDDLMDAREMADARSYLLSRLERARNGPLGNGLTFGIRMSSEISERLHTVVVEDLERQLSAVETLLRERGVPFPPGPGA
ncbi:hypothetical protein [Methylorubrum extorquens]|uniref:Uncharacterized protein n=1 Tax=Methylorubrum extorquens TaxID=408 RepID=A0AAX3WAT9_METEX|nr:hypothetical protein [Methylorubrum extorquens]WHQ68535.1 hypothetical protein KEC54_19415 [Methylorubrum extorquens]